MGSDLDKARIPLFPLSLVVFPGESVPLHIFEDRYKQMVSDVRENSPLGPDCSRPFGIVLAGDGGHAEIGCAVVIEKVIREYPDGKLDIVTRGTRRFELLKTVDEKPYMEAEIQYFDDAASEEPNSILRERSLALYTKFLELATGKPSFPESLANCNPLSYPLALGIPLSLEDKQGIITLRSEEKRVEAVSAILEKLISSLIQREALKETIGSNGFLKH